MKAVLALVGLGLGFWLMLVCVLFGIGALLWPYIINSWLVYSGRPVYIEWWMGGFLGLIPGIGQSSIPLAFITFVLMLFLGTAVA
jgi:hypothetical protein